MPIKECVWTVCAWTSKMFVSGVESLQLVIMKFIKGADRRIALDAFCILVPKISNTDRNLTYKLQCRIACARWVPRMLTENHKRQKINSSRIFLRREGQLSGLVWHGWRNLKLYTLNKTTTMRLAASPLIQSHKNSSSICR